MAGPRNKLWDQSRLSLLGLQLSAERERHGLTQITVSHRLECSPQTIMKMEAGKTRLSVELLLALCRLYGISVISLLSITGNLDEEPACPADKSKPQGTRSN